MSRSNPTFVPARHTVKEFDAYGICRVQVENRWVTIAIGSAYDTNNNLISSGVRIKIKAY